MSFEEKSLLYDLSAHLVTKENFEVLYFNMKASEIWLAKNINREEHIVRIIHRSFNWKNHLKSDMTTVFQRARALSKRLTQKTVNITNIYVADEVPVDDWEDLLKPLRLNDKIVYNMSIFYLAHDNLISETNRLNQHLNMNYAIKEISDEQADVKKKILIQDVYRQKQQTEQVFNYGKPFFTYLLIAINLFMFFLIEMNGGSTHIPTLIEYGAKYNPAMIAGEWWRAISSMFLHIGLLHLFMNMLALYYLGFLLERMYGSKRFLVIYFLSGIGGSLTSFALSTSVSAGASGALFGMFGALLYFGVNYKKLFFQTMGRNIIFVLVLNLFIGILIPNIDMGAHLGGLIAGFLASAIVSLPYKKNYKASFVSLIVYSIFIFGLIVYGIEANEANPQYLLMQTEESIKQADYEAAIDYATRGLEMPNDVEAKLLFQRAYAHIELKEYDDAQKDLEASIEKESHFPEAYYNLAILHYEQNNITQADIYIEKAMSQTSEQDRFQAMYDKIKKSKE